MSKEVKIEEELNDDIYNYRFFERFYSNIVLDKDSFLNMPSSYKLGLPISILIIITALKLGTVTILLNKIGFEQIPEQQYVAWVNSVYLGVAISTILQALIWSIILFGIIRFLGGRGNFLNTLSIYSISQIPILIGSLVLLLVAVGQPQIVLPGVGFDYESFVQFGIYWAGQRIADIILFIITTLYAFIMVGFGLSSEHKVPTAIGLFTATLAFISTVLFYFLF